MKSYPLNKYIEQNQCCNKTCYVCKKNSCELSKMEVIRSDKAAKVADLIIKKGIKKKERYARLYDQTLDLIKENHLKLLKKKYLNI